MQTIKSHKNIIIILAAILIALGVFFFFKNNVTGSSQANFDLEENENLKEEIIVPITERTEKIKIETGSTFGKLLNDNGISVSLSNELYNIALPHYDLAKVREGREIILTYNLKSDKLKSLLYQIDNDNEIFVWREITENDSGEVALGIWQAEKREIPYEVVIATKEAEIDSSLYQSALDAGIDERAIIELANAFQWTLDFSMDTQVGDSFKFIYEERYLEDDFIMPGKILAAKYVNSGHEYQLFYFEENEDNKGYFDEEGKSVQRMFLKAPVEFRYISSGFTTGLRYVEAFNVSTGHRAIDYAAPSGTPVRAVGDGTVARASWNGPYGNFISVRHNGTYTTNYAHLSRYAVKNGQKVNQGDIIGYVGSTGFSTGPHLHYEMVKNGVKVNPLAEVMPPGKAILEENKERFNSETSEWLEKLK
ncbi:MAG: peptidoglycan DD-metalloendopeptidase family protein [Candidatus Magasanikbacteria bacterium]|nr:peptidoglycan DD-metalloendopeptidase family protein [Candidatus Magasanikbacteria bacterium]